MRVTVPVAVLTSAPLMPSKEASVRARRSPFCWLVRPLISNWIVAMVEPLSCNVRMAHPWVVRRGDARCHTFLVAVRRLSSAVLQSVCRGPSSSGHPLRSTLAIAACTSSTSRTSSVPAGGRRPPFPAAIVTRAAPGGNCEGVARGVRMPTAFGNCRTVTGQRPDTPPGWTTSNGFTRSPGRGRASAPNRPEPANWRKR